jgi:hypothetical protein
MTINEYDGNLADAEPFFGAEIIHLDLKGISVGFHPAKINGFNYLSAKAFESTVQSEILRPVMSRV